MVLGYYLVLCAYLDSVAAWIPGWILVRSPGSLHSLLLMYESHHRLPAQGSAAALHCGLVHGRWKVVRSHLEHQFYNIHE